MRVISSIVVSFFLFVSLLAQSQTSNTANWCDPAQRPVGIGVGGFKIDGPAYGCVPFQINWSATVGSNYVYINDYTGGDPFGAKYTNRTQPNAYNIYMNNPKKYTIMQIGSNGTGSIFCQDVLLFGKPTVQLRTCSGMRVQATIANDTIAQMYDSFIINWGDGTANTPVTKSTSMTATHTYTTGTQANVTISGVYQGNTISCLNSSQTIQLNNTNLNNSGIQRVTTRNDGVVEVLARGIAGTTAELQMATGGNGTFSNTGQSINKSDTITFTVRNLDPTKNVYCFKLSSSDACANVGGSSTVCTMSLEATAQNRQNVLNWSPYPIPDGFLTYRITRNSVPTAAETNRTVTQYTDKNVVCGENYAYQVTAVFANGTEARSEIRTVKAISDEAPSIVQNVYANVLNGNIEVRGTKPATGTSTNYKAYLYRADNGSNDFKEISSLTNNLVFTDKDVNTNEKSYCYQIRYENACGNRSEPSPTVCSILLYSKSKNTIDWTPQSPFGVPVKNYTLQILNDKGNIEDQVQMGNATTYEPDPNDPNAQLFHYRIDVSVVGVSSSNTYVFKQPAKLFVPSAFTPNGDAKNDIFAPKGTFISKYEMTIYNRWGNLVFQSQKTTEGWDGNINGQPAPEGTYVYKIDITDSLGERYLKSGTVALLRQ